MDRYDAIVIGAGHNGLTCAAYLAKAGAEVLVVERDDDIGGGTTTAEVTLPGFKHNLHANYFIGFDVSPVYADLELEKQGFRFIMPEVQQAYLFRDGRAFVVHADPQKTATSIARFSRQDADTYLRLYELWGVKLRPLLTSLLHNAPLPRKELRERLRGPEVDELFEIMPLTPYQAIDRYFEDEHIRILIKKLLHVIHANNFIGTGIWFPLLVSNLSRMTLPVGGAISLPRALSRVVEANGGTVITGARAHVEKILVENGRARGVRLGDGTLVLSRIVVSSIDFPQTVRLAGDTNFTNSVREKATKWQWTNEHSLMTLHLALDDQPRYMAAEFDPDVNEAYNVQFGVNDTTELIETFDDMRRERFPRRPAGNGCCNSMFDPTYAPEGKHVAFWWPFAPYRIDGSLDVWDRRREEFTDHLLGIWSSYSTNLSDNVLGAYLYTPLDIARQRLNMVQGSVRMGAYTANQMGVNRPHADLADYRIPTVEGLYHCGSSSPNGGGVNGYPAYAAANAIVSDQGLDQWWKPLALPGTGKPMAAAGSAPKTRG
jgi:phytoene dehydrogenase-like protein